MELEAAASKTNRDRLAASTRVTYSYGLRHWLNFCISVEDRSPLLWHSLRRRPELAELLDIRKTAKRYWEWLHRSFGASTITTYWSAVVAFHQDWWDGVSLADLGISFPSFKSVVAVYKKRAPAKHKEQNSWSLCHFRQMLYYVPHLATWAAPAAQQHCW